MVNETIISEIINATSDFGKEEKNGLFNSIDPSSFFCIIVVVVAFFTISLTPVWIFCRRDESDRKTSKQIQSMEDGEIENAAYQSSLLDNDKYPQNCIRRGSDFIEEQKLKMTGKSSISEDNSFVPDRKEGIGNTTRTEQIGGLLGYRSDPLLILDATNLLKSTLPTQNIEFKLLPLTEPSSGSELGNTIFRNVKNVIWNAVCKSVQDKESAPPPRGMQRSETLTEPIEPKSHLNINLEGIRVTKSLHRSLSLPTRTKRGKKSLPPSLGGRLVHLWMEISTAEEILKGEASAICSAVILKSLELYGYFSQIELVELPSIKITEYFCRKIGKSSNTGLANDYLFRVLVPERISNILTNESSRRNEKALELLSFDKSPTIETSQPDSVIEVNRRTPLGYKAHSTLGDFNNQTSMEILKKVISTHDNRSVSREENFMKAVLVIHDFPKVEEKKIYFRMNRVTTDDLDLEEWEPKI